MRFSFLIPVYNSAQYLEDCVSSILNQNVEDFEIILSDDGSIDDSGKICDQLKELYPRKIRVIHNEKNIGLLLNRRLLFREAKGEWLICVDSDDCLEKHALEALNKIIDEQTPDMILYNLRCFHISGETEDFKPSLESNRMFCGDDKQKVYRCLYENNYINSMCTKAIRRDVADIDEDYSQCNVSVGEDAFQTFPLLDRAKRIYYLDDCLYLYRKNETSMTESMKYDFYDTFKPLWQREQYYREKWELDPDVARFDDTLRTKKIIQYLIRGTNANGYKWLKSRILLIKQEGFFEKAFRGSDIGGRYKIYGRMLLANRCLLFLIFSRIETLLLKIKS